MTEMLGSPLLWLIAACEVGFWVLLSGGLAARYLLRARRLSTVLLGAVPVLDLVLVGAVLADVATGGEPGSVHGLAGLYLGFTIAFGPSLVRWADARVAHRVGGPPPPRPPDGAARVAYEWREWGRLVLAWAVGLGVMALVGAVAGTGVPAPADWAADPMWSWGGRLAPVALVWLVFWPLWVTVFPPRAEPATAAGERRADR